MPVYAICPKFLSDSCESRDPVIEDMFYKHFLPKSSCRIVVDKKNFVLNSLSENRSKSDVISHFLDRIANDRSARRQSTIVLDVDSDILSFEEILSLLAIKFPTTGRVVCDSEQVYSGSGIQLIEGVEVSDFMAQDCCIGASVVVNDKSIHVGGDNYGAPNTGDDAKIEVLIDKINITKVPSEDEWGKLLKLLDASKQQACVMDEKQAETFIDVIMEHAKNFNYKGVVKLLKEASGPAKLLLSGAIGFLSGI